LAWRIAERVPGAVPLVHPHGCDLQGPDADLFGRQLALFVTHPNVGGVLFLTMSCAATNTLGLSHRARGSGRLVAEVNMHQVGGTTKTIEHSCELLRPMVERLAAQPRQEVPLSSLVVGTKCGSSNADSFAYCHPVLGAACDRLVDVGATVVLSEDCELCAGEEELAARAATPATADDIRSMAGNLRRYWVDRFHQDLLPPPEDVETCDRVRRRSLEHAMKAGSRPIRRVVDMQDKIRGPGLVILNGPNTDLESMTCLAASGCQLVAFTTGAGTVVGSPVAVTVKMTATRASWERMRENLDLDVSGYKEGTETLEAAAARTFDHILSAANGELQAAERLGHWEVAFPIRGVTF
jgi:altronate dehydratase large subunit